MRLCSSPRPLRNAFAVRRPAQPEPRPEHGRLTAVTPDPFRASVAPPPQAEPKSRPSIRTSALAPPSAGLCCSGPLGIHRASANGGDGAAQPLPGAKARGGDKPGRVGPRLGAGGGPRPGGAGAPQREVKPRPIVRAAPGPVRLLSSVRPEPFCSIQPPLRPSSSPILPVEPGCGLVPRVGSAATGGPPRGEAAPPRSAAPRF